MNATQQHPAAQRDPSRFRSRLGYRRKFGTAFHSVFLAATLVGIVFLVILLVDIWGDGAAHLSGEFMRNGPSRFAGRSGIYPALIGSIWVMLLTAVIAFPLGVGTAIWLEEYAPSNRMTTIIETNIANLAGVPSIVYGILGLTVFVRGLALGRSVLAGALTLALLILPVVIIAAQEALKAVPSSMRLGSYAVGATRWETIRHHVLPHAMPGILTGTILALSRAVGEAAPLLLVGAVGFVQFAPRGLTDAYTVIPIQIFNWTSKPQAEFQSIAASGSIVLLVLLLAMNAVAILLRNRYAKRR